MTQAQMGSVPPPGLVQELDAALASALREVWDGGVVKDTASWRRDAAMTLAHRGDDASIRVAFSLLLASTARGDGDRLLAIELARWAGGGDCPEWWGGREGKTFGRLRRLLRPFLRGFHIHDGGGHLYAFLRDDGVVSAKSCLIYMASLPGSNTVQVGGPLWEMVLSDRGLDLAESSTVSLDEHGTFRVGGTKLTEDGLSESLRRGEGTHLTLLREIKCLLQHAGPGVSTDRVLWRPPSTDEDGRTIPGGMSLILVEPGGRDAILRAVEDTPARREYTMTLCHGTKPSGALVVSDHELILLQGSWFSRGGVNPFFPSLESPPETQAPPYTPS